MRRNNRMALLIPLVFSLTGGPSGFASPQGSDESNKQIEVRIFPKTKVLKVGEALELRVEIWNVGGNEFFIEKDIYRPCGRSLLSLYLELGPPVKPQEGWGCSGDCLDDPKASLATRLVQRWISLPPGHFYGTIVHLDPESFPQLQTPGRWRLGGKYRSQDVLSSSLCMNHILLDSEQTDKLPYKAWQGEEATNMVWIEVVRPSRSGKEK